MNERRGRWGMSQLPERVLESMEKLRNVSEDWHLFMVDDTEWLVAKLWMESDYYEIVAAVVKEKRLCDD